MGPLGQVVGRLGDFREIHLVRVTDHRDDDALFQSDRQSQVHVLPLQDPVAVHGGVQHGVRPQGVDDSGDEERGKRQPDAGLLLEPFPGLVPEAHDVGHVDFRHGGHVGGHLLAENHVSGNGLAEGVHVHDAGFFGARRA